MSCADVQTIQAGNGVKTQFSFDFPYIFKSEVQVSFWNATTKEWDVIAQTDATYPWQVTDANPTIVEFTGTAPPSPAVPVDPNETSVDNVRIRRVTNIDDIRALFNPGSAIRSDDLNKNFEQLRYAIQEANCQGVTDDVYQYLLDNYWDRFDNTLYSADAWRSDDATIATTAALDQRFQDEVNDTFTKAELAANSNIMPNNDDAIPTTGALNDYINEVITNDIGTDGTGITVTDDGDGTITLGLAANAIDLDRIKNEDIITYAEEVAGVPSWDSDNRIPTTYASSRRFDTLVQTATPSGSDWPLGKTWIQNDSDRTVYIWDGTQWLPIASGGAFTTLPKVVYVDSINGDDSLEAHRLSNPKKTIKAAIDQINADVNGDGSVVIVAPGIYGEQFPIDIQKNDVSIIGNSLRNCIIHPAIPVGDQAGYDVNVPEPNELSTMFRVNSGTYIANLTLTGMKASGARGGNSLDTDATYGLPTNQGWNFAFYPNAVIRKSPYIQNCTNFSDSQINNVNFTPHTPGEGSAGDLDSAPTGGGILIDGSVPAPNSPLRSMVCDSYTHTALDGPGIFVTNNGYCQATSSYSFFGHYHLKAKNGGQANLAASTSDFGRHSLIADGRSTSAIFTAVTTASASSGATTFTIGAPVVGGSWHGSATRPQDNMLVDVNGVTYPVLSAVANGAGWDVTISRPDPANLSNNLGLNGAVGAGAAVEFYLRSMIASSGHTMEYVGSGTDYRALPENGGVPDSTKETVELNNGKIWAAITDHKGTFKVGGTFTVNQQNGFITFGSGSFAIPSLIVDLDVNGNNIYDSTGDISLNGQVTLNNNKIVNLGTPTAANDAATKAYVDGITPEIVLDTTPELGGQLDALTNKIVNLGTPTSANDAATKAYVDSAVGVGGVTSVDVIGGTGLTSSGGPITSTGSITVDLDNTAVTPGSYTYANITVDQQGRLTAASNGTTPLISSDIGVTVQPYDATTLVDADIGVTVQPYDADTAKLDVAQSWTGAQSFGQNVKLLTQKELQFADSDSSNYVGFKAPTTVSSDLIWTLPASDGTSSQVLQTDGSGVLSFATISAGPTLGTAVTFTSGSPTAGTTFTGIPSTANRIIVEGRQLQSNVSATLWEIELYPRGYYTQSGGEYGFLVFNGTTIYSSTRVSGSYFVTVSQSLGPSVGISASNSLVSFQHVFTRVSGNYWVSSGQAEGRGNSGAGYMPTFSTSNWLMSGDFTSIHVRTSANFVGGILNVMYD